MHSSWNLVWKAVIPLRLTFRPSSTFGSRRTRATASPGVRVGTPSQFGVAAMRSYATPRALSSFIRTIVACSPSFAP